MIEHCCVYVNVHVMHVESVNKDCSPFLCVHWLCGEVGDQEAFKLTVVLCAFPVYCLCCVLGGACALCLAWSVLGA